MHAYVQLCNSLSLWSLSAGKVKGGASGATPLGEKSKDFFLCSFDIMPYIDFI